MLTFVTEQISICIIFPRYKTFTQWFDSLHREFECTKQLCLFFDLEAWTDTSKLLKNTDEAESRFHWSMTQRPPCGTARSPWQAQRFSGYTDVVNKWGESWPTSGRLQACAKWSVFPVNLLFLNPVKLRQLPETSPADLQRNAKFKKQHASMSLSKRGGKKQDQNTAGIFIQLSIFGKSLRPSTLYIIYSAPPLSNPPPISPCHNMPCEMVV